jgi:hypothetical protein
MAATAMAPGNDDAPQRRVISATFLAELLDNRSRWGCNARHRPFKSVGRRLVKPQGGIAMASVACTLRPIHDDSVGPCHLEIARNANGHQTWRRWATSKGGFQLGANAGTWYWEGPSSSLVLDGPGGAYWIVLAQVPSDFLTAVSCGRSISGAGDDSNNVNVFYELWYGCT